MDDKTEPCLVQTSQGFTVSYKEKFLYSKYNPSKAINQIIQDTQLLPQTLILCVSPILSYGLRELAQKLPQDCIMLGCEYEEKLYDFIHTAKKTDEEGLNFEGIHNFSFLTKEELLNLGPLLTKKNVTLQSGYTLPNPGTFRRVIRIDFSAGVQFNSELYEKVTENAVSALMTFWANRVTLVKFGRKYCTNFFRNLSLLPKTVPIQKYFGAVDKPIVVFGAGESVADGIKKIKSQPGGAVSFFILCADTALQPLAASGIVPDGVFIEEAQNVISRCFIGVQSCNTHIFAGLSSIHSITRFFKPEQISFFTTEFTQANFIDRFKAAAVLPPQNLPFGSVGITAYYYASLFRQDASIPIYTYGLDFAYSAGRTHTKGTMADNARFMNATRLKPAPNFEAAFCEPAFRTAPDSQDEIVSAAMYTTPVLQKYRQMFIALSSSGEAILSYSGEAILSSPGEAILSSPGLTRGSLLKRDCRVKPDNDTNTILSNERTALLELKALLTGEKKLPAELQQEEITKLICEREYLYLHFPDGHKFVYTQSFLNRVRVEVEYFLKVLS